MAENKHAQHTEPDAPVDLSRPEQRHERTDADVWALSKFAIALLLTCIASLGLVFAMFRYFEGKYGGVLPRATQSLTLDARRLPPAPQLEVTETQDLAAQRAAEYELLSSYGWVDREHGIVRIPIDQAIDLLAASHLPARQTEQPQTAAAGVSLPTASGLGPKMQPPGGPLAGQIPEGLVDPAPAPAAEAPKRKTK
ncbi:MAG TPA: hypothetical protein VGE89_13975 [Bryobacteraceae bacterium]|jgi:hypothetical protein